MVRAAVTFIAAAALLTLLSPRATSASAELLAGSPGGEGWRCDGSGGAPPTAFCGASAGVVGTNFGAPALARCVRGGSLLFLADSVSRHALFDWAAEDAVPGGGCGVAELDGVGTTACSALERAGARRGNYLLRLGAGGAVAVEELGEDGRAIAAAVRGGGSGSDDLAVTFLSATFFRNVTAAPWLAEALAAAAAAGAPVVVSAGLWNVKYDADGGAGAAEEARVLADALRAAGVAPASVLWRGVTATDARPLGPKSPAQYTPSAVAAARAALGAVWAAAGAAALDPVPFSRCAPAGSSCGGGGTLGSPPHASGLTLDGTHLPPAVSVGLMRATAAALCAQRPPAVASAAAAAMRGLTEGGSSPTPAPSAPAVAPAGGLPAALFKSPSPELGAGAYAAAMAVLAATALCARALFAHRAHVEAFVRAPLGAIVALGAAVAAIAACDVWPVAPVVEKARAVGFDSMLLFVALVAALATYTQAPVSNALPHGAARGAGGGKVATPERSASPSAGGGGAGVAAAVGAGAPPAAPLGSAEPGAPPPLPLAAPAPAPGAVALAAPAASADDEEAGKLLGAASAEGALAAAAPAPPRAHVPSDAPEEERVTLLSENHGFFPLAQTLEFKGWMMSFFLMYHYWDVKAAYNPVRVCVGAYLFLTGFGNFLSLAKKGPSLQKLAMSVLRINFFPCLVMIATGRAWVLYYIAPLHTVWTVVVYVYYWLPHPPAQKLLGILGAIVVVYELPMLADYVFLPLYPLLGYCPIAKDGLVSGMKEFVFRSRLDAYAPWSGMVFAHFLPGIVDALDARSSSPLFASAPALLQDCAGRLYRLVETAWLPRSPPQRVLIGAALALAFCSHSLMYSMPRFEYNAYHRATEWFPICSFLVLRNLTPALRRTHLRLYAWLGEMSLELYILQFHVWMAADAKKLTVLLPSFRGVSFLAATLAFVVLAWVSNRATGVVLKFVEGQGRATALGAAGALLGVMMLINMLSPRACSAGGAGGR
jgi:hypothetical protein